MGVDHTARVRPGDRWDGLTLVVTRSGVDWASAVWALNVRSYPRGPVVLAIAPMVTIDGDTVTLVFHLSGEATSALRIGTTYYGEVSVHVAGALPGDEPAFGPYTLFTWSLEAVLSAQTAATQYTITWSGDAPTYVIELTEGGVPGTNGWSPILAITTDGARRVMRVTGWTGGNGNEPASGQYVGLEGFVTDIADAVDVRGATGATGATGPAPSGTGLVSVTNGALDTPSTLRALVAGDASNLRSDLGLGPQSTLTTNQTLIDWTEAGSYQVEAATYDSDGVVTTATVVWPDGSAGTFTRTAKDATFLSINGYTITHANSSKTVTQATVTRDSGGRVTTKPALTVAP